MEGTSKATLAGGSPLSEQPATPGPLKVSIGTLDGKAVLNLAGEFDLSSIEAAESGLADALAQSNRVVIDLSKLEFIDSTGIAFLVGTARNLGDRLAVEESDYPDVKRVFEMVGMPALFRQSGSSDGAGEF